MIRYADKEDLPHVYVMYLESLTELGEKFKEEKALEFVLLCWAKAPCLLLLRGDEIAGFAGLNTYRPSYDDTDYLREYMFYIKPQYRGIKAWRELCKGVQNVADEFNMTFIGEHRLIQNLKQHERLIRMAGAKPFAIKSVYEGKNGR